MMNIYIYRYVIWFNIVFKGIRQKKTIESLTAVKPTPKPPPSPIFDCIRFFSGAVFIDWVVEYGMTYVL